MLMQHSLQILQVKYFSIDVVELKQENKLIVLLWKNTSKPCAKAEAINTFISSKF